MFVTARFRTYCHATEEEDRVRQALRYISGVPDKEVREDRNKGYHGNEIKVLTATLKKGPKLTTFLERLTAGGIFDSIGTEMGSRLDEDCVLYLRFDKQSAYLGEMRLDEGQDTIQVRLKVQTYPAKPDKAVEAIRAQVDKIRARLARR